MLQSGLPRVPKACQSLISAAEVCTLRVCLLRVHPWEEMYFHMSVLPAGLSDQTTLGKIGNLAFHVLPADVLGHSYTGAMRKAALVCVRVLVRVESCLHAKSSHALVPCAQRA